MWRCKWCARLEQHFQGDVNGTHEMNAMHDAIHKLAASIHGHGTHENRNELKKLEEVPTT